MGKKVLVISSSMRKGGNSDRLADEFLKGALAAGHQAEKISLAGKHIEFCRGCMVCQETLECVIKDDAIEIAEKMRDAEVIAFATPIYYYEMSGQLKTLLDRANALYSSDYAYGDIYVLSSAAEDEDGVDTRAVSGIEGWVDCFDNARLAGTVFAGGVNGVGDIEGHPALKEAYDMGYAV